jgi:hypothetical protein
MVTEKVIHFIVGLNETNPLRGKRVTQKAKDALRRKLRESNERISKGGFFTAW